MRLKLKLFAILALLALVGAGGGRALASVSGPAQGEPQAIVDLEGKEIAALAVTDLVDPFEEYSEFTEPDEGTRFVLVTVEVENTGERPFEFSPYDIFLRDTLGRTYGSTFISVEDDFEEENPTLEDRNMSSGETHSGVLYFVVAEDAELSDVLYQSRGNDTSVLNSIADLSSGDSGPAPAEDQTDDAADDATPADDDADAADDGDDDAGDDDEADADATEDSAAAADADDADSTPES